MDVRVELWRRLSTEELMLLNCGVGEDSWESLGLQGDPTNPFWEISPGIYLEGMMLKLKLQYFGHLMRRVDSLEKTLRLGGIGGRRRRGRQDEMAGWHHWLDGHESEWTPGVGDGQGGLACCDSWGCKESDTTERLNWTETKCYQEQLQLSHTASGNVKRHNHFERQSGSLFKSLTQICHMMQPRHLFIKEKWECMSTEGLKHKCS